ncbi:phosphatidylglycerophosphatase B [Biostraticola tofi]|uniref:undecaprenyl-diphosphate phosphatase n=1 Tax=Biostraticola tofi TaxID=466109 RepID=A0A4R3Z404_9GAMM|nr:phosphatidylglycerophosphatase B [Biostraticola tofi]TCV99896.1 phosphatidylglycerophosphatase B [Biostraticola tofi]
MPDIAKRTALGALLLVLIPLLVWASGWQWQPGNETQWLRALYWTTQTVTSPWGALTSVALFGWFLWCLRFRLRATLLLALILAGALLFGQGVKTLIKNQVQESRPYVLWLEKSYHIDDSAFYALPRKARSALVAQQLENNQHVPAWLRKHWQYETGFAFPSGHTIFAASWALLAVGLLWPRRRFISVSIIMLWATAVMSSRMVLGMHWPRDLVVGVGLSWLIIVLACWLVQRWVGPLTPKADEARDISQRS